MATRKNMTALQWLLVTHPDIYDQYKAYDKARRRERAKIFDKRLREQKKLKKISELRDVREQGVVDGSVG